SGRTLGISVPGGDEEPNSHVEPPFAIELSPMEDLVRIDAMPSCDDGDRCSWLQRLFHYLTPLLLRALSPLPSQFSGYDLHTPNRSHPPRITASAWQRKTVLTGRLQDGRVAAYEDGFTLLELTRKYYHEASLDVRELDLLEAANSSGR